MQIHPPSFLMVWFLNGRVQLYGTGFQSTYVHHKTWQGKWQVDLVPFAGREMEGGFGIGR